MAKAKKKKKKTKKTAKKALPTRKRKKRAVKTGPSRLPVVSTKALYPHDSMAVYMSEIRRYPLLTPEEEHELAVKYRETGDKLAAEKLVTSNLRFVVKVAAEYSKFGARLIDLVQEGNVGLMHAVREFNPYKGVRLITYAVWWIRGYIREYLLKQYSMVRIGTTHRQRKLFYNLEQEQQKLEALGHDAPVALLSSRLGVPESDIESMKQRLSSRDISLNQPISEDSDSHLIDIQADNVEETPESRIIAQEQVESLQEQIDKILPSLNEKEIYILDHRLLADEPITLQEIGDRYGITRERARQLEARVIRRLKDGMKESAGSDGNPQQS